MPILNFPLVPDGAIVEVSVGVSDVCRQALSRAGRAVPQQTFSLAF